VSLAIQTVANCKLLKTFGVEIPGLQLVFRKTRGNFYPLPLEVSFGASAGPLKAEAVTTSFRVPLAQPKSTIFAFIARLTNHVLLQTQNPPIRSRNVRNRSQVSLLCKGIVPKGHNCRRRSGHKTFPGSRSARIRRGRRRDSCRIQMSRGYTCPRRSRANKHISRSSLSTAGKWILGDYSCRPAQSKGQT